MTWNVITDRRPKFSGECVICREYANADRAWEVVMVRQQGATKGGFGIAHARCAGGDWGGVKVHWRGPVTIETEG